MATRISVIKALPTITQVLRARADRFGGGGNSSGCNAARGLRGDIGALSLIAAWNHPTGPTTDSPRAQVL
jgi:hypothetical protein